MKGFVCFVVVSVFLTIWLVFGFWSLGRWSSVFRAEAAQAPKADFPSKPEVRQRPFCAGTVPCVEFYWVERFIPEPVTRVQIECFPERYACECDVSGSCEPANQ